MSGYVYFITTEHAERVKIGYTRYHPSQRLRELQCGSPFELCVIAAEPGTIDDERELHGRFERYRLHGEWFEMSLEIKEYVRDVNRREYDRAEAESETPERWCRIFRGIENGLTPEEVDAL